MSERSYEGYCYYAYRDLDTGLMATGVYSAKSPATSALYDKIAREQRKYSDKEYVKLYAKARYRLVTLKLYEVVAGE